jgi:hypothetical protein
MQRDYADLMNLAVELGDYSGYLDTQGKKRRGELQTKYKGAVRTFVYNLLKDGKSGSDAADAVNADLDEIVEVSSEHWHPVYEEVRGDLLADIERESGKASWQRTLRYWLPFLLASLVAITYGGARLYSATPVSASVETREGLQQRAYALDKVLRYDDWASVENRRGGWFKAILLWPIEPTKAEIDGASELGGVIFEGARRLQELREACNVPVPSGQAIGADEIVLLQRVTAHLRAEQVRWQNPPVMTVLDPIRSAYRC